MSIKNFLTRLFGFLSPHRGPQSPTPEPQIETPSNEQSDEDFGSLTADEEEIIRQAIESIKKEAQQYIAVERMVKLKTGEQILGMVICNTKKEPVISKAGSINFITVSLPAIIRTMYIPNQNTGMMQSHHMFEEWISNIKDTNVPVDVQSIQCVMTPGDEIVDTYKAFVTKNRMYRLNPTLARHVFELPYLDSKENILVEMDELADDGDDDNDDQMSF